MSGRTAGKLLALLPLLLAGARVWAATDCSDPAAGGVFDSLVNSYSGQTANWLGNAENYAKDIFWSLAAIEFAWSAITWVLRKNTIGEYLASLFFKVMSIAFFYMLISQAGTWIPYLLQGFEQMAGGVSGSTSMPTVATGMLSPSAVMNSGLCVIGVMTQPFQSSPAGVIDLIKEILPALTVVVCMAIMVVCYFIIVLQLTMTEVEAFIVLFGGLVMLGFTGSRWTAPWGEKYFGYAVSVGIKLMVIFLVVSMGNAVVAQQVTAVFGQAPGGIPTLYQDAQILLMVLVYAGLVWNLPALAGTFLNGSPNMSLGTMAAPAMAAAGAVVGASLASTCAAGSLAGRLTGGGGGTDSGGASSGNGPDQSRLAALGQKAYGSTNTNTTPASSNHGSASTSNGAGAGSQAGNASPSGGNTPSAADAGGNADAPVGIRLNNNADPATGGTDGQNAFNDPNASAGLSDSGQPNNSGKNKTVLDKLNEFGLGQLRSSAQHLKTSDGSTGSVSIRLNHTD